MGKRAGTAAGIRRAASAVLLLIVVGTFALPSAGRAAAAPSAPETTAFEVETRDGTVLRGHVTLPEGPGPFATILELSPYFNTEAGGDTSAGTTSTAQERYLEQGYAIGQVNMRGTGLSDGCLQFGNKIDQLDAYDVIEALADRSWSNGNVGMIGHSYSAWSQYMAVAADPPSLKAVIPTSGVSDPYELLTRIGAPIHYGPFLAPVWSVATGWAAHDNNVEHICADLYASHVQGTSDLIATGDRTKYWAERNLRPLIKNTDVAVWRSNGLNYWGEGHWHSYDHEWELLNPHGTNLILGQWNHETPTSNRDDWYERTTAFFDEHLRGGAPAESGVVEFQDTAGNWHTADSWPPGAKTETLHLSGTSLVEGSKDVESSQQAFVTAPGVEPGLTCGGHQAFWVSEPVEEDVILAGYFDINLSVTSTMPGGNLVAVLRHVPSELPCEPDASDPLSMLYVDDYESAVGRMQMDLRHWKTHGKSELFPVAEATKVREPSGPFAAFVPKGHRLALFIAGGSMELEPDQFQPLIVISTGKDLAGSIEIPVVEGDLRFGG
ncbi:MAG TPA: CocE/NonD family hydrolase [Actinomycetota bacterium]|nr:CocE/NonD family hydrolase [Actinomycetota bacterium]